MDAVAILAVESAGAEEEGGNFLVTPNVGLMIWTLIAFGITLFILYKLAFPRITAALDRRQRAIEESIDSAERTKQEADVLLAEYRERLGEARRQAEDIVMRARRAGEQHEAETMTHAREQRDELMAQTRRDIEAETRRAIGDIRREVADLTVLATEKVTRKSLTPEDQRRLVDEALQEVDFDRLSGDGSRN
ncbi:MAG: F0F1 ATP synthase subunit B [Solirubrobacterales bacterium]|nr:F0F1 ATP synthase subunit B [Solirubrobacterales bacterium]